MSASDPEKQISPLLEDYQDESIAGPSSSAPLEDKNYENFTQNARIMSENVLHSLGGIYKRSGATARRSFLPALVPSFLRSVDGTQPKPRLHPTSYLDGLRGVAAFIVWIHHFVHQCIPTSSYGWNSGPNTSHFFQMPIIRVMYSGRGMVTIFFVISGYVLSYKSLRQIRNRQFEGLLDTLASATFRRGLRLFLPIVASTFLTMIVFRLGWYIKSPTMPAMQPSFIAQFSDWWWHIILLSNPTTGIDGNDVYNDPYGSQLWTIPREFRGSLVIYLTLLGIAKTTQFWRLVTITSMILYTTWVTQWDLALFLAGMILAEIQFIRDDPTMASGLHSLSRFIPQAILRRKIAALHTVTILVGLLGIHMLTFPDEAASTSPGYKWMLLSTPPQYGGANLTQRYWLCIGAILVVVALNFSPATSTLNPTPMLQRPFNTRFAQYLANVSYALYITHMLVISTVTIRMYDFWKDKSPAQFYFGLVETFIVNAIFCFWLADIFWRLVDLKSIALAKWLADKCFIK
ncbi:hypothetical protein G7Y89_g997 [Cudoniella acicularis]|uniref:Acyltransferase 3 domain-containing protein n=1 Tax=Cudoniella acicularis TaxID=354080 RepID=A0A8H4RY41_9HELO|nr:hypothetical protein G7Y89_g997 [Cudoniella acicularis]